MMKNPYSSDGKPQVTDRFLHVQNVVQGRKVGDDLDMDLRDIVTDTIRCALGPDTIRNWNTTTNRTIEQIARIQEQIMKAGVWPLGYSNFIAWEAIFSTNEGLDLLVSVSRMISEHDRRVDRLAITLVFLPSDRGKLKDFEEIMQIYGECGLGGNFRVFHAYTERELRQVITNPVLRIADFVEQIRAIWFAAMAVGAKV